MNKREMFWELVAVVDDAVSEMGVDVQRSTGRVVIAVRTGDWRGRLRAWWAGGRKTREQEWRERVVEFAQWELRQECVVCVDGVEQSGIVQFEVAGVDGYYAVDLDEGRRVVHESRFVIGGAW